MKNIIYSALMIIFVSSCQGKKDLAPASESGFSIRFIDKNNEIGTSYVNYTNVQVYVNPLSTSSKSVSVCIAGLEPVTNDIPYSSAVSFARNSNYNANVYTAENDFLWNESAFSVSTEGKPSGKVNDFNDPCNSLSSANPKENLTITKDDATTLEGTFRVRISDFKQPNPTIREIEGFFSIPKKGRF